MRKLLLISITSILCLGLVACKKKPAEEKKEGEEKTAMTAMDMEPGDMEPGEVKDPMDMEPDGDTRPEPDTGAAALAECKKLYADHYAKFVPVLAKLGIEATASEVVAAYGADKPESLKSCVELTPEQRACAMKQPNPLSSRRECKFDKSLTLFAPSEWSKKIDGEAKPLEEKEAKALQAWLAGTWVHENPQWKRKEVLVIDKAGKASGERFKDDQPDGKKEEYEFSFQNELQIHRKWGTTTQTFTFFKSGPKAFAMSSNMIYNVVPIVDKKAFTLKTGSSEVALVKDGQCEVINLSTASAHSATCVWGKDEKEKKETFKVSYKPDQYEQHATYFHVDKHLVHEHLWKSKFEKK